MMYYINCGIHVWLVEYILIYNDVFLVQKNDLDENEA